MMVEVERDDWIQIVWEVEGEGASAEPTIISSGEGGLAAISGAATGASARSASPELVGRGLPGTVIEGES